MAKQSHTRRPVIAVTGSAGKSTTKEMIASILSQRWRVLKSFGNNNAPSHIRKLLRKLKPYHRACVLEFGASRRGMIAQHCRIKRPTIGIITLLGTAHIGKFGGMKRLIETKSELIKGMHPDGVLILNRDDPRTPRLERGGFRGKTIYFGIEKPCHYRGRDVSFVKGGMRFTAHVDGADRRFFIPIYGRHNVYNALAAIAAARQLGFSVEHIRRGLARYFRMARRMRVRKGIRDITVIDDSYSATPEAVKAAIDVLVRLKGSRTSVAVLGGMAELGGRSERIHGEIGEYATNKGVDRLITVGDKGWLIRRGAVRRGMPLGRTLHFRSLGSAVLLLPRAVPPGSIVLVKASHRYGFSALAARLRGRARRRR
ncbi:MAG: UDP-N-acetylmuramoyl-tripeptide--D-alanyl-D-alanine ligase [Firmicutes bacterium]|nr:UDP-N-acetylmuramoyl-tripeptide--D-alanyl-D-alanine ligase [Bacillota bacterium]